MLQAAPPELPLSTAVLLFTALLLSSCGMELMNTSADHVRSNLDDLQRLEGEFG